MDGAHLQAAWRVGWKRDCIKGLYLIIDSLIAAPCPSDTGVCCRGREGRSGAHHCAPRVHRRANRVHDDAGGAGVQPGGGLVLREQGRVALRGTAGRPRSRGRGR